MFRRPDRSPAWAGVVVASALIVGITAGHYMTEMHNVAFHNVYRRLYYLPIVMLAFARGLRGGLGAALVVSLAYTPHAFLMEHHHDPAPGVDKGLEMLLYFAVGGLTGWLVEQQRASQRALEQALQQRDALHAQLVRAGKLGALGELVAGLAHEIRNPLASIMGSAEALASEFDEGHRKHRMARVLLREIDRLDRVVSELLAFARPTEPARRDVDLRGVVADVVELARHRAPEALAWRVAIKPGELIVWADPDQLQQVVLNLTLNALQALEGTGEVAGDEGAGDGAPEVAFVGEVRRVGEREHVCLGVQDNGPGPLVEDVEQLFDPFFTTREQGSGLGLSISSRIAEAHGGFLDVVRDGAHTIFWICLPVSDASLERA